MTHSCFTDLLRRPRADAQRNRERILAAAREAFTRGDADVSLDDVAKSAKVGAGTLYRHFPTRDALIEAVYRSEVEKLAAAEGEFAAKLTPVEALRAWMRLFIDYVAAKQLIVPVLDTVAGGTAQVYARSGDLIKAAMDALVERAVLSGDLRGDVDAMDLLRALVGVSSVASAPDWPEGARRLVDILIAGSRPENILALAKGRPDF
jgi:AcrR family transcriptional regulator